ncbi:MAG TPA: hydrogen peroxide-dependent heme synthase [Gemmatimonadaceae bacterium]|nr:hydrogen peroxide-dependent heme synthase [Gemmatimonadaceae bacterium]
MTIPDIAHPPETLEGWYALHQVFRISRDEKDRKEFSALIEKADQALRSEYSESESAGWSCFVRLIGSNADLMVIHFRDTLDAIGLAQDSLAASELMSCLEPVYSFLSVTEAGLYHLTAELTRTALARGGKYGDDEFRKELAQRAEIEQKSDHVRRRLYPELPAAMNYVCFYPMSKRRESGQNWYSLSLDDRSRLMQAHGLTGRRYAGRVQQVITGAIGLDAWEWGVTLFAADPIEFKRLVTDMRFDEVSARYAEFGDFYVGKILRLP